MKSFGDQLKVVLVGFAGALLIGGLLPATALAADNREGQSVTIGPDEVINDDLYVAANTIDIQGTVNGNVIAAGTTITVSGTVTRDINAAGNSISIPGEIQGSARLAGSRVNVSGKVAGDLVVAASTVTLQNGASVGRDVMAASGTAALAGPIARNVYVTGGDIVLSSSVGGNVTAYDTNLKLDGAKIQGNLDYTSNQAVQTTDGAVVTGSTHRSIPTNNGATAGSYVVGWIQTLVGFFLLGALVILLAPRFNAKAVEALHEEPWSRLGIGLATVVGVPIVALMAFVLGLFVGGWWLGLFLIGAYAFALALGFTLSGEMTGRFLLDLLGQRTAHPIVALIVGLVVLLVVTSIPLIGWLVGLVAVIYGAGVLIMALPWSRPAAQAPPIAAPAVSTRPVPSAG